MKRIFKTLTTLTLFVISGLTGALGSFLTFEFYKPKGWLLTDNADIIAELPLSEKIALSELITRGNIISTTDVLSNFTTYYHSLISLLITIVVLLAGFITFNFHRSKEEHDEILKHRLNKFFKNFEKGLESNSFKDTLDEYEALRSYLQKRVSDILENSEDLSIFIDTVEGTTRDILDQSIFDAVQASLDQEILEKTYEY